MHAAALRLELKIPGVHSLKEKRYHLKRLRQRLGDTFPLALAEVDHQDAWQRSTLGAALVAAQAGQLERIIHGVQRLLLEHPDFELIEVGVSYLEER